MMEFMKYYQPKHTRGLLEAAEAAYLAYKKLVLLNSPRVGDEAPDAATGLESPGIGIPGSDAA